MRGIHSNREGKIGGMLLFLKKDVFIAWAFTSVALMERSLICNVACDEDWGICETNLGYEANQF